MLLPGITAHRVSTPRLNLNLLDDGRAEGEPVLFVHGNVSSAAFFQPTMLALPAGLRALAVDLRGFGDSDPAPVVATRGLADYADDIAALVDALDLERMHLVTWSMGSGVTLQYLLSHSSRVASLTMIAPMSPYGFGGTIGATGELRSADGAGTGGGTVNPDFVDRLRRGDMAAKESTSPRRVLREQYLKPPFILDDEDRYVASMLSTRVGDDHYPGNARTTDSWPGAAPGDRGVLNAISPVHVRLDGIDAVEDKPPILWVRGDSDVIIADTSFYDLAYLGSLGFVPDWPGADIAPPQPMLAQTRAVLDRYAKAGGSYREVVIADAGHTPFLERPEQFSAALHPFLRAAVNATRD
jgi:pimeloyl-ACP methyl ester carboxylesterase